MSIEQTDLDFLREVNEKLKSGVTLTKIAFDLGTPYETLYSRIRRSGYKIARSLVPDETAPDLEST